MCGIYQASAPFFVLAKSGGLDKRSMRPALPSAHSTLYGQCATDRVQPSGEFAEEYNERLADAEKGELADSETPPADALLPTILESLVPFFIT